MIATDPSPAPSGHVRLADVVEALDAAGLLVERRGELPTSVTGIADDSRQVQPGALFIAVRGSARDGHAFVDDAAARGAVALLLEDPGASSLPALVVREGRRAAALAAVAAFGSPASRLSLVGVTGTNGKTTTVGMLRHLLDRAEAPSASIGTLGVLVGSGGEPRPGGAGLTTPGPVELQRMLRALADQRVRGVAIEVSSHALDQRRVEGVRFDAAVFTNLTRDHLDYHGSMDAYLAAKARLVEHLAPTGAAVVNADDPTWASLPAAPRTITFSTRGAAADVVVREARYGPTGTEATLVIAGDAAPLRLPLLGDFNVDNAAAAAAAAWSLGLAVDEIARRLATLPQVPGRLERLHDTPAVLRDYSHTPDSLARALAAVRPFARGRVIAVFGCGGDRDRGKRPVMGRIAEEGADLAILTSDNPRTEDPEAILDDIEAGMERRTHERIEDRRAAIARALEVATDEDLVLLSGKGHETYQIRGTTAYPFDEREIVHALMAARTEPGASGASDAAADDGGAP